MGWCVCFWAFSLCYSFPSQWALFLCRNIKQMSAWMLSCKSRSSELLSFMLYSSVLSIRLSQHLLCFTSRHHDIFYPRMNLRNNFRIKEFSFKHTKNYDDGDSCRGFILLSCLRKTEKGFRNKSLLWYYYVPKIYSWLAETENFSTQSSVFTLFLNETIEKSKVFKLSRTFKRFCACVFHTFFVGKVESII